MMISGFEDVIAITEFNLKKEVNNHSKCYFKALIKEKSISKYLNMVGQVADIYLKQKKILSAIVLEVNLIKNFSETYIEVVAQSYSVKLDSEKHTRLFQNPEKTLNSILNIVNSFSPSFDIKILDKEIKNKIIKKPILQYDETDFEFINRMANENEMYLWLDDISNNHRNIKIYKSLNTSVKFIELEKIRSYRLKKDLLSEVVEITLDEYIELGKVVQIENIRYFVTELEIKKEKEEYLINYTLTRIDKLFFEKNDKNKNFIKLKGRVIDNNDPKRLGRIKVDFIGIEELDNEKKIWIDFKTPYSNNDKGFVFIPEVNDLLDIEFDGENFIASSAIRENPINNSCENLNNNYIYNSFDKKITFKEETLEIQSLNNIIKLSNDDISLNVGNNSIFINKDSIILKCNDLTIKLSDGIEISGNKINIKSISDINIKSGSDINIKSDSDVTISGTKGINLN